MKKNIAIVTGGDVAERNVSLQSAKNIALEMDKNKYNIFIIELNKGKFTLQGTDNFIDLNDFSLRSRYFLSIQKPLNGKSLDKRSIYASGFNELFIDISNQKLDRNRFFTGIGYGLTNNIRLETGYLIQSQKNIARGQFQFIVYNNLSF